jgi:divalent metal cation (Fe/Co/Zn/Cd) transporter
LNLVGKTADADFLRRVTFIALNSHPKFRNVDTVQAWYMGDGIYVELDMIVDPDLTVAEAHDMAEELQLTVEQMQDVERCYVHIDYEFNHSHANEHLMIF